MANISDDDGNFSLCVCVCVSGLAADDELLWGAIIFLNLVGSSKNPTTEFFCHLFVISFN